MYITNWPIYKPMYPKIQLIRLTRISSYLYILISGSLYAIFITITLHTIQYIKKANEFNMDGRHVFPNHKSLWPHEACVARGDGDDALRVETNHLSTAIADYKHASKSVKSLESQSKPKAPKAKAKASAKGEVLPGANPGPWSCPMCFGRATDPALCA